MSTDVQTPKCSPACETEKTPSQVFLPAMDIHEDDNAVYVSMNMPGAREDTIEMVLEKGVLTIRANVAAQEPDDMRLLRREYMVGPFEHALRVSDEIDTDRIEAKVSHGVLMLTMPKRSEVKPRKIEVRTA